MFPEKLYSWEKRGENKMGRKPGEETNNNVAVAIDKDKGSQFALKWTVENLLSGGQTLTLLHIRTKQPSSMSAASAG